MLFSNSIAAVQELQAQAGATWVSRQHIQSSKMQ